MNIRITRLCVCMALGQRYLCAVQTSMIDIRLIGRDTVMSLPAWGQWGQPTVCVGHRRQETGPEDLGSRFKRPCVCIKPIGNTYEIHT